MKLQTTINAAVFIIGSALLYIPPASAQLMGIVDHDTYTTDLGSGLDWLDLTTTLNISQNDVKLQLLSGGTFEGWRYATTSEFNQLVSNYTETVIPYNANGSVSFPISSLAGLVDLLGNTYPSTDAKSSLGMLADLWKPGWAYGASITSWYDSGIYLDYSYAHRAQITVNNPFTTVGSHLVRSTGTAAVPIPAAAWFMGPALLGVLGFSRRNNRLTQTAA